jgi:uncharacterized protein YegL
MPIFVHAAKLASFYRQRKPESSIKNLEQLIKSYMLEEERTIRFHFIFCLDESGSMCGSPWAALLSAYQTFINKRLNDQGMGDVVSTITFGSEYRNQGMLVPIGIVNIHLAYHGGGTNFDQALLGAREALARTPTDCIPYLLFVSDGCGHGNHTIPTIQSFMAGYRSFRCDTIGLGEGVDVAFMTRMAEAGGGRYHPSDIGNISDVFGEIAAGCAALDGMVQKFGEEILKDKKDCTQEGAVHQGSKTVAGLLSDILKCNAVVLLIDGLDEAAGEREQIEVWIDEVLNDDSKNLRMMVSTREYAFESSREFGRLREFESIQIQGLDEQRRELLIERRLKEEPHLTQDFQSQLQVVADKNPELATSPFLLSLIIEVFLKDVNHKIPTSRAGLYEKQIDGVLVRHQALKNPLKDSKALMQGTDMGASTSFDMNSMRFLLEAIAFSCQVRLERRDFEWDSADLQEEVDKLSQLSHSEYQFCSISKFSSDLSSVGLLSKVGDGELRFSHLTLQEYLAASCAVRLFAHDPRELWSRLSTVASGHQPNTPVFLSYSRR